MLLQNSVVKIVGYVNRGLVRSLHTGLDNVTGGAGDDSIVAKIATMGALDVIDAGAGTDTLTIEESVAIASLPATFKNVETVYISTTAGDIGTVYAAGTAAGTNTAAVAQAATVVLTGTYATGDTIDITIGGVVTTVTVGSTSSTTTTGQAEAATAVAAALTAALADSVTIATTATGSGTHATTSTHTIGLTSKVAGTPLPSISVVNNTVAGTATASLATAAAAQGTTSGATLFAADVTKTGPIAIKEVEQVTIVDAVSTASAGTDVEAGTIITVTVGGIPYAVAATGASSATAATAAEVAVNVASAINTALGGTTAAPLAAASGAIVTVTAPVAGTPLPTINVEFANASDFTATVANATANQAANSAIVAGSAAVSVGAPAGTTSYTATAAAGNANVSGAKTTDLTVKGAVVQTSGGADVSVGASNSVFVKGATGAVTVKTGATTTSIKGAVTSDTGGTAADAAGVYVTGGTTVDITGSSTTTGAIKVGAAGYAKAAVNITGGLPQSNGNAANAPSGDVSISTSKASTSSSTGLKTLTYATGARDVYTNGAEAVSVKGGSAVSVTDVQTTALQSAVGVAAAPGTSTLAKVTLAGLAGDASITSDALTDIYLSDTLSARTVTVSNSGAEGVNTSIALHTSNTGTAAAPNVLNHATAESVVLGSTAANGYTYIGSTLANAGSASFVTLTTPKAAAVTAVNTLGVTLGDYLANAPKIGSINASGATGSINVTIDSTPLQGTSYIGGSGKDTVVLKASANLAPNATTGAVTSISLGAGNDTLANANTTAHTMTGVTIDGCEGIDTVYASLMNAGNASQFIGFENLGLDFTANGSSYDVSLKSGISTLVAAATIAGSSTVTYSGVTAAQSLVYAAAQTAATSVLTLSMGTAEYLGAADSYTITAANGVGTTVATSASTVNQLGKVNIDFIENVNIVSTGAFGYVNNTIIVGATRAKTVTIIGDQDISLTTSGMGGAVTPTVANGLGVSSIDATGLSGDLTLDTANVTNYVYGLTVSSGSGTDNITLSGGIETVKAGAGNDTITTAAASSTLSGEAGNDTFVVTLANAKASGSATGLVTKIKDFQAGDVLDFIASSSGAHAATASSVAQLTLTTETTVDTAITNALNLSPVGSGTAADVAWFYWGGNTYVVFDAADDGSTDVGLTDGDIVVKLTGQIDLTGAGLDVTDGSFVLV